MKDVASDIKCARTYGYINIMKEYLYFLIWALRRLRYVPYEFIVAAIGLSLIVIDILVNYHHLDVSEEGPRKLFTIISVIGWAMMFYIPIKYMVIDNITDLFQKYREEKDSTFDTLRNKTKDKDQKW
jgi:hypothetical protein